MVGACSNAKQQTKIRNQSFTLFLKALFFYLPLLRESYSFRTGLRIRTGFAQSFERLLMPLFFSQPEDNYNALYKNDDGEKTLYRRQRKTQGIWGREVETLKQVGVQARRKYRYETKKEKLSDKAEEMAYEHLSMQGVDRTSKELSKEDFQTVVGCFQRLLEELEHLNERAYQHGKDQARMRQADMVSGNATDIETYLDELEHIRLLQQERRHSLKQRVFDKQLVDTDMACIDTEELLWILRVRGNIENFEKSDRREVIEELVRESFAQPLF